MAKNPYLDVIKQIVANAVGDRQATAQQADTQQTQAYINYMNAQKNLATGLANQGVSGGGSESALLGANVGYQNTLNTVNAQKASSLNDISRDAQANKLTAEAQSESWLSNEQAKDEQRFASTITGYDTIAKCDNAIAAAKANGQLWKVNYLMAQRAALKEQAKYNSNNGNTGGGGGGGGTTGTTGTTSGSGTTVAPFKDVIRPAFNASNTLITNAPTRRTTQPAWLTYRR